MTCDQCAQLAGAWLDGELDLSTGLEFERHLRQCPGCTQRTESLRALGAAVHGSSLYVRAPAGLQKQVRAALRREAGIRQRWRIAPIRWAAIAAAIVLAAFIGWRLPRGPALAPEQTIAQEVLSAHLRSLMADHLLDVPSSDRHTVKPWFAGKLDFSPEVRDFPDQGFTLQGGRLEYLDGRPTAALVYRHGRHVVNVFIRPAAASFPGILASQSNGYHELHWVHGSMEYWAVSDAAEESLRALAQDINAGSGATTRGGA